MHEPLTEAEIAELERLEREAYAAPWWFVALGKDKDEPWRTGCIMQEHAAITDQMEPGEIRGGDAELVVALRNAAPRLLRELREARARIAELEARR
jgi:hypothetical protein